MTRTSHHPHPTPAFPVYALDWADDETLILAGGGGASRSGIENKIKLAKVNKDGRAVKYTAETKFSAEEDAPMTLAVDREGKRLVTGVNASSSSIKQGRNEHVRVFEYTADSLTPQRTAGTIRTEWSDDYPYQKLTVLSPSRTLVAVGTTDNRVSLLGVPELEEAVPTFGLDSELVDLDWGADNLVSLAVTTVSSLFLYKVSTGEKTTIELVQTIYSPSLDITSAAFRSARFSPLGTTSPIIHAVLNATKSPKRGAPRKAWVCTFGLVAGPSSTIRTAAEEGKGKEKETEEEPEKTEELGRWDVIVRREVSGKPVTVFDVSTDGRLLAYGSSDLSLGILDAKTLAPLLKILHAHNFPPTALKFNPSANMLVSASADNTIRAVVVPASFEGMSASMIALLIAILVILLALILRR
ncbi:quinon protein alcohol dehydrogenase-like superfamily [Naematelia encephala]|uniref:Quinon protein alcohol dehydrogenase-like superfamily n=1 Tax=Naematelia encephala TaxID=71784 RepID=A0A1Y2BHT1_9TREE|nr:quinon protein alcohol dehydrogenase-like superfamily [Naematelia encephala]